MPYNSDIKKEIKALLEDSTGIPAGMLKKETISAMGMTQSKYMSSEDEKELIMSHKGFSTSDTKHVFSNVLDSDIDAMKKSLNDKLEELQKKIVMADPTTFDGFSPEKFHKTLNNYAKELAVQYDSHGLQKTYEKITKVLMEIPNTSEYREDLQIIKEIKNEYITTKKMSKSNMLYLNKIYKQITKSEEDDANTKSPGTKKENRYSPQASDRFKGLAGI